MFDIQEELKKLPDKPGVYLMKDHQDTIIYVGKAINLKNRVRSYFRESSNHIPKVVNMVKNIKEFEYIVTDSELEALILECNLIKEHRPKYNVLLKDDKSYPYIKVTLNEKYPRIFMVHRLQKDKAKYFGPFTSRTAIYETLELIHKIWPLRRCLKQFPRDFNKERPCLNFHIGQCIAPCMGTVEEQQYLQMIEEAMELLNGKQDRIVQKLEKEMAAFSEELAFEKAADLRDKIIALKKLNEKQKIDSDIASDQDIIAFARADDEALFQVFFIRSGKMTGREHFLINGVAHLTRNEVMTAFVKQFYTETSYLPKELILETEIDDYEIMTQWLSMLRGKNVTITIPQKGDKFKLVQLAHKNAIITLEQFGEKLKKEMEKTIGALQEIQEALAVEQPLTRIEAYDISNIQGVESVASMIVFENGKPKRSDYRKFKIKGVLGPNDYASMAEVIRRRFLRYQKEQEEKQQNNSGEGKFSTLPDVLFIDGGKGQVHVAEEVLKQLKISIPVCGMIKDDRHRTRGLIYQEKEILLDAHKEGFKLVTRIQDEVHRFAIEYHRKLREKVMIQSILDDIPTIGTTRKRALLKHFGSVEKIKEATMEELAAVAGMNLKSANAVYHFLRK